MKTVRQVSAGGVLLRPGPKGAEVLLAARRTRRGEVVWGLPKGLVEKGESFEEAAIREVREETGFEGAIVASLGNVSYWFVWEGTRINKTVHFFLMEATGGDAAFRDMEMEDVDWFPLATAAGSVAFTSEREIIRKAAALQ
ncbi:MAG TPA: NUDIX hydrolase [Actinomycetota bacterium]|nr:NUDIX hydrolase [Actinomycetota bacterium]